MKVILHIGLHKTGTSYLQKNIFPNLKDIHFGGRGNKLISKKENILISNESFSGIPYYKNEYTYFEQFEYSINKLNSLYKIDRVIIGFREPNSILKSFYKQFLHEQGTLHFDEFFGTSDECILKPDDFKFLEFYKLLITIFGDKNVFAFDHGDLIKEHDNFIKKLVQFLNTEITIVKPNMDFNKSVADNLEKYLISMNQFNASAGKKIGLDLYHPKLNRWNLTPRKILQIRLRRFGKDNYKLNFFPPEIKENWQELKSLIEIK
jgi:hypothetical protein